MPLDPWGPVLAVLFEDGSSDYVLRVLKAAGIPTDSFNLSPEESYSHKTRKRAYENRLAAVYSSLGQPEKRTVAENVARQLARSAAAAERLNQALVGVGWILQGDRLLPLSPAEQEAFFPKGTEHDAYVHIRSIIHQAKQELLIIDPYMDSSIYQLLATVPASSLSVRLLSSKIPADFALEGRKFTAQHSHIRLELRKTRDFHDRFVFVDGRKCYLVGASIKDAGTRGCTITPIEAPEIVKFICSHADEVWSAASSI